MAYYLVTLRRVVTYSFDRIVEADSPEAAVVAHEKWFGGMLRGEEHNYIVDDEWDDQPKVVGKFEDDAALVSAGYQQYDGDWEFEGFDVSDQEDT